MKYYTSYEKNTHQTPKEKKQEYWKTAIGLQQVDQLKPSNYLLELSQKNIEENLSNQEIEKLLYSHYTNESKEEEIERKMECDIVANRIVQLLQDDSFTFSPAALKSIHRYLFQDIQYLQKRTNSKWRICKICQLLHDHRHIPIRF